MSAGALDGLLVADFSRVLAGPLATMTLGDLGADVVKVERPGTGDDTRAWGPPFVDEGSTYYLGLNRNKRSVVLDLADDADRELARRLALRADVLVESFRPGLMARWGLDHGSLAAENPGLVYCSVTAFGSEAGARLPGYDLLLQAMSGLMSVTGEPDGRPLKVGAALIDMVCGLHATIGVLAALQARAATGTGQRVEVSLMQSGLASLLNQASAHLLAGVVPGPLGNRHPSIAPYETFEAANGSFALAVGNDMIFARLCDAIGKPDLARDERFTTNARRLEGVDELGEILSAAFASDTAEAWVQRLTEAGVPAGPINDIPSAFALAARLGLAATADTPSAAGETLRLPSPPIGLSGTPAAVRRPPPRLGEHSDDIRAWLASADG
jgi:crotonobetainyl-CoA:carnitine CoA-transferase CaiB-like acyl-CoA transferase